MIDGATPWTDEEMERYYNAGCWENKALGTLPKTWAEKWKDRTAITDIKRSVTYKQLEFETQKLAQAWIRQGLTKHDRVVVQLPNRIEFATVLLSLMRVGAIPVLALPAHRMREISHILDLSGAVAYIIPGPELQSEYENMASDVLKKIPSLKYVYTIDRSQRFKSIEEICTKVEDIPEVQVDPNEVALMLLSGGTTGLPKLIPRTHNDYYYNFTKSAWVCKSDENTVYLASLPAAHNFSLACPGLLGVLESGGRVVMAPSPDPISGIDLISKEKVSMTSLIPALTPAWIDFIAYQCPDLSSLKLLQIGGSKLDPAQAKCVRESFGCQLQQVFGMAEGLLNFTQLDDPVDIIDHTQGKPMSSLDEILIVDSSGNPVPEGSQGELWTCGPYTIKGYYAAPEYNSLVFSGDGFYKSGDIVSRLETGHLIVHGRVKDVVKRGGEEISLEEVREYLELHDSVKQAAAVLADETTTGEQLYAVVVPVSGQTVTLASLRSFLIKQGLATYKLPSRLKLVLSLPLTSVGKIDTKKITELLKNASRMLVRNIEIPVCPGEVIAGELDCPAGKGPWNTVILFHGSGPSDRHATVSVSGETISQNFKLLAERIVNAGFAVFRYDKRGDFDTAKIISDAEIVVKHVAALEEVDGLCFYGWSQGVQVAAAIAKENPDVKGLILHAGIAEGWPSYFSYILEELVISIFKQLDQDGDGVLQLGDFKEFIPAPTSVTFALSLMVLNGLDEGDIRFHQAIDPQGKGSFSIQEDWIPLAKTIVNNPTLMKRFAPNAPSENWLGVLEDIKEIAAPMFVIQGNCDGWVSPKAAEKIAKAGGSNADIRIFPGLGHALSPAASPFDDVGGVMDEKPLEEIVQWLQRRL